MWLFSLEIGPSLFQELVLKFLNENLRISNILGRGLHSWHEVEITSTSGSMFFSKTNTCFWGDFFVVYILSVPSTWNIFLFDCKQMMITNIELSHWHSLCEDNIIWLLQSLYFIQYMLVLSGLAISWAGCLQLCCFCQLTINFNISIFICM